MRALSAAEMAEMARWARNGLPTPGRRRVQRLLEHMHATEHGVPDQWLECASCGLAHTLAHTPEGGRCPCGGALNVTPASTPDRQTCESAHRSESGDA